MARIFVAIPVKRINCKSAICQGQNGQPIGGGATLASSLSPCITGGRAGLPRAIYGFWRNKIIITIKTSVTLDFDFDFDANGQY